MRNRLINVILVVTFFCYSLGGIGCEYSCNQHGHCENGRCKCVPPWTGPDCSIFTCPSGFDWGGNHTEMVQCSGRGTCTKSGCKCYQGFSGVSCQILGCPTDTDGKICYGHGKCLSVKQHSKLSFKNWECSGTTPAAPPVINYYLESEGGGNSWDANRIFGCECEGGWTGYDCSIKVCPYGAVNRKTDPDTTSYLVNPLKNLETKHEIKKSDGSNTVDVTIPAKWSLFIKNCEGSGDDGKGTICKAHNITVPCNITFTELRDVIRKDGIVNDIVIYSPNEECDRLSCKGDINIDSTIPNGYEVRFIFVVDKSAGLVQITDELYDRTVTPSPTPPNSHIINGYCLGRYESTAAPTTPTTPTDASQLYTIPAPTDKLYMECSGLAECINGICEKCYVESEARNSYLLKDYVINKPNVRNCQVKYNDLLDNEDLIYCNNGGMYYVPDEDAHDDTRGEKSHIHCECSNKYTGYTCKKRSCDDLKGTTFYGYAFANNKGHLLEVCSGEGSCVDTGCKCRNGFAGTTCNKLKCGNKIAAWMVSNPRSECSGRGDCIVASEYIDNYNGWDKESIGICDCNDGFTGYNCEDMKCPYGADPLDYILNNNYINELPGVPFIDIYDANKLTEITALHFFTRDIKPSPAIKSIKELNEELLNNLKLEGPISYFTCTDSDNSPACSGSIKLGDGNNEWKKLSITDTTEIPSANTNTHLRIYLHYYCVEDLRRQTIRSNKESYIKITAKFIDEKEFGINEGRLPCYECSNQGICDKTKGICTCLGRYGSSNGVDENGNINVGRRGDCGYVSPYYYRETEV